MNGPADVAQALLLRAESAAALLPEKEDPAKQLLGWLVAAITSPQGFADMDDLTAAVEHYERDVQRRVNGGAS